MPAGVLFAFGAYFVWACGDAAIKALGSGLSIFEISFFNALFSVVPMLIFREPAERWRDMFKARRPLLVHGRSATQVVSTLCIIVAFTTVPLAEVYSVIFLTPVAVVIASVIVLREHVSWQRWALMASSFLGVLLVVKPGFQEIQIGHITALIAVSIGAFNVVALRLLAGVEKRVTLVGTLVAYGIIVNAVLMAPSFAWPNLQQWLLLVSSGVFGGCGQLLIVAATRRAGASEVAPTQYSQMLWALILGAVFFQEFPDALAFAGLAVLVVSGLGIVLLGRPSHPSLPPPA